ncbi:hypothetical protein [Neoaquamicrobium sediminum]|uniref:Uncharacterized protein n=1 Tax=Neoaquamicrobium sediminum TaxID=1849104 RepID=A0ABV3WUW5_9HYPH
MSLTDAVSYPFRLTEDDVRAKPYLFLGQAIQWIICRGRDTDTAILADGWQDAEQQLFDFLDAGSTTVSGYRPGKREYENLPHGIWARMNKGHQNDPRFSPIDDAEQREDCGSVEVGMDRWNGVRIPVSVILETWPPAPPGEALSKTPKTIAHPREDVVRWFIQRVEAWKADPEKNRRIGREKLWEKAKAPDGPFPRLSSVEFRAIWDEHAPPAWKERGRIPKNG